MQLLLFILTLSFLGGCGGLSRPYYAGHLFEPPRLTEQYRSQLVRFLQQTLEKKQVDRIEIHTHNDQLVLQPHAMNAADIDWLPLPALIAIRHILSKEHRGVELDFLARIESGEYVPVTAQHELDQRIVIHVGRPLRSLTEQVAVLTPQQLSSLYHTGPIESGTAEWSNTELVALQQALSSLSAAELRLLSGVRFVRSHRTIRPSQRQSSEKTWGQYVSDGVQRTIYLYDTTISHDERLFVGTPDKPLLATTHCLLHEIGHALADDHSASAGQGLGELLSQQNGLDAETEENQVLAAYAKVRGRLRGPTPYGATALNESFAESFALFRADPAALSRVSPEVHEWFLRDGHVQGQNVPKALRD